MEDNQVEGHDWGKKTYEQREKYLLEHPKSDMKDLPIGHPSSEQRHQHYIERGRRNKKAPKSEAPKSTPIIDHNKQADYERAMDISNFYHRKRNPNYDNEDDDSNESRGRRKWLKNKYGSDLF